MLHVRLYIESLLDTLCSFSEQDEDGRFQILKFPARGARHGRLSSYLSAHTCQHVDLPASKSATCASGALPYWRMHAEKNT